jgi:hypothetical protein
MYMTGLRQWKDETEWLMFLDIDEFLCIRGSNDIKFFVQGLPLDWDCVQFNWIFFGNNGWAKRPGGSVLQTYTKRSARLHTTCKTLTRTAAIDLARVDCKIYMWHTWDGLIASRNVLGINPEHMRAEGCLISSPDDQAGIMARGVVHHYAFKSVEGFRLRYERGVAGSFRGKPGGTTSTSRDTLK